MNSFRELMNLVDENQNTVKDFLVDCISFNLKKATEELAKSRKYGEQMYERIRKIDRRKDVGGYGNDLSTYYMNEYLVMMYEYSALLVFCEKLSEEHIRIKKELTIKRKKMHHNKYEKFFLIK